MDKPIDLNDYIQTYIDLTKRSNVNWATVVARGSYPQRIIVGLGQLVDDYTFFKPRNSKRRREIW